jgi:hypothetical protein
MARPADPEQYYFRLSSAGDLDTIQTLFCDSSTYRSAHTSVYLGGVSIMAMQRGFFAGSAVRSSVWRNYLGRLCV